MTRWSTSSVIPVDYMKAITSDEVRAILGSGRQVSALIADASVPGVDRELISLAVESESIVIVIADGSGRRDWNAIGAVAVLDDDFTPEELTEILRRSARALGPTQRRSASLSISLAEELESAARTITVAGAGGSGSSTVAMALAQALGDRSRLSDTGRAVALVDGARRAHLSLYHDVGDVIPGLPELIDAHRADRPDPDEIGRLFFRIEDRGYDLLLGRRRPRDAASMGPISTAAAIEGVRRAFDTVIIDVDSELDGEGETGSVDIENHHGVTRVAADSSDLVLLVVRPGMKGMHDLVELVDAFSEFGVRRNKLLPVVNLAPRSAVARAALTKLVAQLSALDGESAHPPIFLPQVRSLEDIHNCASRLPSTLTAPLGRVVDHLIPANGAVTSTVKGSPPKLGSHDHPRIEVA
ncbi:MAG: hypothetical protein WBA45_16730 [Microthrixaceae bacterium]